MRQHECELSYSYLLSFLEADKLALNIQYPVWSGLLPLMRGSETPADRCGQQLHRSVEFKV